MIFLYQFHFEILKMNKLGQALAIFFCNKLLCLFKPSKMTCVDGKTNLVLSPIEFKTLFVPLIAVFLIFH